MAFHLVVRRPFLTYAKGDVITDETTVEAVLASNGHSVARITAPEPEPEPEPQHGEQEHHS